MANNLLLKSVAFWTSVASMVTLNVVLALGLLGAAETPLFGHTLTLLHVVLPISSVLMLVLLVRDGDWTGTVLFAAVVLGMVTVAALGITGLAFSRGLHLVLDLCALNAYLIVVPSWRRAARH